MTKEEQNQKLVNTITGNDVVAAVDAVTKSGELAEKITTSNFKKYVEVVSAELYKNVMAEHPEFSDMGAGAKDICRSRTKGLLRYLAVMERI